MSTVLTRSQASGALPHWRYLLGRMHLAVKMPSFPAAIAFVNKVAEIAEQLNLHPEIDVRYTHVQIAVSSHDADGITDRDVAFATAVDEAVEAMDGTRVPSKLTEVEIAIDTMDHSVIKPFWQAVLGYDDAGERDLVDPLRIGPSVWFQQLEEPRPVRNRIHFDVTVAHDEALARIEAALLAGGRLVSDEAAPSFWILADSDGNEACVCTWQGRDEFDAWVASDPDDDDEDEQ